VSTTRHATVIVDVDHPAITRELPSDLVHVARRGDVETARTETGTPEGLGFERWLAEYARVQAINRGSLGRLWTQTPETIPQKTELFTLLEALLTDAKAHRRIRRDAHLNDVRLIIYALGRRHEQAAFTLPPARPHERQPAQRQRPPPAGNRT
jgi:hypothetical protein